MKISASGRLPGRLAGMAEPEDATAESPAAPQVEDDPDLLRLMLRDRDEGPAVFRPTNHWRHLERRFLPYLRRQGLRGFRRCRAGGGGEVFGSFGATDLVQHVLHPRKVAMWRRLAPLTRRWPRLGRLVAALQPAVDALARSLTRSPVDLDGWRRLRYEYARRCGELAGAVALERLEASAAGDPEDLFEIDGRFYTSSLLEHYHRYAYCSRFVDFGAVELVVELGGGAGKQAEVLHRLHPDLTLLLFDIPPQLYVAHQYLTALFGDAVVPYRATRDLRRFDGLERGRIYLFGSFKWPLVAELEVDLFWSAATFQEMEPDVVRSYLEPIDARARNVYLLQLARGARRAVAPGRLGVLEPTTWEHYESFLPSLEILDASPCPLPHATPMEGYIQAVWRRR